MQARRLAPGAVFSARARKCTGAGGGPTKGTVAIRVVADREGNAALALSKANTL